MPTSTRLDYLVTLTRPDGSVVETLTIPVLQETADAAGNASSRLEFAGSLTERRYAEQGLRSDLKGLESVACGDANDRAIEACQDAANPGSRLTTARESLLAALDPEALALNDTGLATAREAALRFLDAESSYTAERN